MLREQRSAPNLEVSLQEVMSKPRPGGGVGANQMKRWGKHEAACAKTRDWLSHQQNKTVDLDFNIIMLMCQVWGAINSNMWAWLLA